MEADSHPPWRAAISSARVSPVDHSVPAGSCVEPMHFLPFAPYTRFTRSLLVLDRDLHRHSTTVRYNLGHRGLSSLFALLRAADTELITFFPPQDRTMTLGSKERHSFHFWTVSNRTHPPDFLLVREGERRLRQGKGGRTGGAEA